MAYSQFFMIGGSGSNLNSGSGSSASTIYTSAAGTWDGTSVFTPTDGSTPAGTVSVGDWCSIYPVGNTTTPYIAQVTAVANGVNGTITFSTSAKFGTSPVLGTGNRSLIDGGAWADLGMTAAGVALNTGTVSQSTCFNVKVGTYANTTTARTLALAGAATTPLWWRGYKTTPGDQDTNNLAVAGTDIPSFTFTTAILTISGAHQMFWALDVTGAANNVSGQVVSTATGNSLFNFRVTNTNATANGFAFGATQQMDITMCWFKCTTTASKALSLSSIVMLHGCTLTGGIITISTTSSLTVIDCIFDAHAGDAISTNNALTCLDCSFNGSASAGNGINLTTVAITHIANCYFSGYASVGKAAVNNTSGTNSDLIRCVANAYFNCASNTLGLGDFPLILDNGTLASEAFTAPGSQNFNILPVGQGIGFPGNFATTSTYVGHKDVGAVQHADPAPAIITRTIVGMRPHAHAMPDPGMVIIGRPRFAPSITDTPQPSSIARQAEYEPAAGRAMVSRSGAPFDLPAQPLRRVRQLEAEPDPGAVFVVNRRADPVVQPWAPRPVVVQPVELEPYRGGVWFVRAPAFTPIVFVLNLADPDLTTLITDESGASPLSLADPDLASLVIIS